MSQYPPNFSYVEVDKAVGSNSLETKCGNLGYGLKEILEDLDFGTEGLDLKSLGLGSCGLGCLASCEGLPQSSN